MTDVLVVPSNWEHVCACRFGEGRIAWRSKPSPNCPEGSVTKWSGDSYRYDIYKVEQLALLNGQCRRTYALRWWNGSGEGWLISEDLTRRDESNLLEMIAQMPVEERRWDACHFLWETATKSALAASRSTRSELYRAFVDGRLTKRKNRGENSYKVNVEPKIEQVAA